MATGKRERNEVVEQQLEQALRTMHDAHRRNDLAYLDEAICGNKADNSGQISLAPLKGDAIAEISRTGFLHRSGSEGPAEGGRLEAASDGRTTR